MADTKLDGLFVEILTKGMAEVQKNIDTIKSQVQQASEKHLLIKADTAQAKRQVLDFTSELKKIIDQTPASLTLKIEAAHAEIIDRVRKEVENLPRSVAINVIAEKVKEATNQVIKLQEELKKTPNDKNIHAKLIIAENLVADLEKELDRTVKITPEIEASKAKQKALDFTAELQKTLSQTPASLTLKIEAAHSEILEQVRKEVENLPRSVAINVIAEKVKEATNQVVQLEEELKRTPDDKTIQAKLVIAGNLVADLQKELDRTVKITPELETSKAKQQALDFTAELQKTISQTPATIGLKVDKARTDAIEQTRKELDKLPRQKRIQILTEKANAAKGEVEKLQKQQKEKPDDKGTQEKLKQAKGVSDDLNKELGKTKSPFLAMAGYAEKAAAGINAAFGKMGEAINTIGPVAQRAFAIGSASIAGFIRAADPVGVQRLQGTIAAIAVQLGSIFLPILDSVKQGLESFLSILRNLDDSQKDQIVRWTKIAGAVALTLAVLPKVVSGFTMVNAAIRALGVSSALATGGLTAIVGILAAAVGAFALFGEKGDESKSGMDQLAEAVRPLMDAFSKIGETLKTTFKAVLPLLVDLGKVFLDALVPVIDLIGIVAKELTGVLAIAIRTIAPIVKEVLSTLIGGFKQVVEAIIPLIGPIADVFIAIVGIVSSVMKALLPVFNQTVKVLVQIIQTLVPVISQIVETVAQLLESLAPSITALARVFGAVVGIVLSLVSNLLTGLSPIIEGITDLFGGLGDIVSGVIEDLINPILEAFADLIESLGPLFETVFGLIKDVLISLGPIFKGVFGAIEFAIMSVAKALIYVGTLLKELGKGNFSGAIEKAGEAVDDFEEKIRKKREEREDKKAARKQEREDAKKPADDTEGKKQKEGRHGPTAPAKVELTSFAEVWKKAQQSAVDTPEQRAQQERNRVAQDSLTEEQKQTALLERIADKEEGGGFGLVA